MVSADVSIGRNGVTATRANGAAVTADRNGLNAGSNGKGVTANRNGISVNRNNGNNDNGDSNSASTLSMPALSLVGIGAFFYYIL